MSDSSSRRRSSDHPSDRFRLFRITSRFIRIAFVSLLALSLSNCRSETNLQLDTVAFKDQAVSYPSINDDTEKVLKMSPANCFWTGATEELELSWDAVAIVEINNKTFHVDACTGQNLDGGTTPEENNLIQAAPWNVFSTAKMQVCSGDTYFDDNAYGECRVKTRCRDDTDTCGINSNFPYCGQGCAKVPTEDTTYDVVSRRASPAGPITMVMKPTFYRVPNVRTLARKTSFDAAGSNIPGRYRRQWSVQDAPDGGRMDDFSPNLFVSRVRAFIPAEQGALSSRGYLNLRGLTIGTAALTETFSCDPDSDDGTQVTSNRCPALRAMVPTHSNLTVGDKAVWRIDIAGTQGQGGLPISEDSNVFVEFTVATLSGSQTGPHISPSSYDFGDVPARVAPVAPAAIAITNDASPSPWLIDSIRVTGANASEFSAQVHGNRSLPVRVSSLDSVSLDVHFNPGSSGNKSATLEVHTISAPSAAPQPLVANLFAYSLMPALLSVAPSSLSFDVHTRRISGFGPWRLSFLIENAGPTALQRLPIGMNGPDASFFRLMADNDRDRVATNRTLAPGESEIVRVWFCPPERRDYNAEIAISGNASGNPASGILQTASIALHGSGPPNSVAICAQWQ